VRIVPHSFWARAGLVLPVLVAVVVLLWWQGPDWSIVGDAFTVVRWHWIVAAIGLNLVSVVVRSLAWRTVIKQAMPPPRPRYRSLFSAFSIGLLANAVLPGRIGELARVAVLTRKLPGRNGAWATLVGTVFAHRLLELPPALLLVVYVLLTAKIPHWAITSLIVASAVGVGLLGLGVVSARRHHLSPLDGLSAARRLVTMARHGLGVLHAPLGAAARRAAGTAGRRFRQSGLGRRGRARCCR
jgi:hypothetical protein